MQHVEIERKYLLDRMPAIPAGAELWRIEQGYLSPGPGRLRRVRLADGSVVCTHTVKTGKGVVREETERTIPEGEFEKMWPQTAGRRLRKNRYRVAYGGMTWEIDEFEGLNLVLAEIELDRADATVSFPAWLKPHVIKDVTDDPAFTNASIAERLSRLEG